jgi:hypothetical protein
VDELARIIRLIFSSVRSRAVYVAAKLELADELADGPLPLRELARRTDTSADALRRLLRLLADDELVLEVEPDVYAVTTAGRLLARSDPESAWSAAVMLGEHMDPVFAHVLETMRTGRPAADRVFGKHYFEWLGDHPDEAEIFNLAMSAGARARLPTLLQLDFWPEVGNIVDVGGGDGTIVAALLKEHAQLRGTVFDLPHAEPAARRVLADVADRASFEAGDFFASVPAGADVYLLLQILHDWTDEDAGRILLTVRRAIGADSRLVVVEEIVPENGPAPVVLDFSMLVLLGGRERTEAEWRALLAEHGFEVTAVTPGPRSAAIEARPV